MTNRDKVTLTTDAGNLPTLRDYLTGAELRPATAEEHRASIRAARFDGGAGVIVLDDGRRCYVTDPCPATLPATGRSADAWWAWHDADPSRHSPGETPTEGTETAERRCAAWLRGASDDGPRLTPWQSVRVWWLGAGQAGAECTDEETIAALREYRRTGGMYLRVLADPATFDADGEPLDGEGPNLCEAGPAVDAIDWTGFDDGDLARLRDVTDARIYSYEIVSGVEVYGLTDDGAKLARSLGFRVDVDSYGQAFPVGLVVRRTAKEVQS